MDRTLIVILVLAIIGLSFTGCLPKDKTLNEHRTEKTEKKKIGFLKRLLPWNWFKKYENKKVAVGDSSTKATPREQLNKDFSKMWILWLMSGAVGIGLIGFGAWLQISTKKGISIAIAGGVLLLIALGGPVAVYIFKTVAIILGWVFLALAVAATIAGIYFLVVWIKKEMGKVTTLVHGGEIMKKMDVRDWDNGGREKVMAIQDKELQDRVNLETNRLATKVDVEEKKPLAGMPN